MPTLPDLSDHIIESNEQEFVKTYLLLLMEGYTLSVPNQKKLPEIKDAWSQILSRLYRDFDLKFLDSLSKLWHSLIMKQGGKISDKFSEEMLIILNGGNPEEILKEKEVIKQQAVERQQKIHGQYTQPLINEVKSNISTDYYDTKDAQAQKIPDKDKLDTQMKTAIKQHDHTSFLTSYLATSHYDVMPKVPRTTLLERIRSEWEEMLILQENKIIDEDFLDDLSALWFSIVNRKGIPYTLDDIKDIRVELIAKNPQKNNEKHTKKKSFLNKLFNT